MNWDWPRNDTKDGSGGQDILKSYYNCILNVQEAGWKTEHVRQIQGV